VNNDIIWYRESSTFLHLELPQGYTKNRSVSDRSNCIFSPCHPKSPIHESHSWALKKKWELINNPVIPVKNNMRVCLNNPHLYPVIPSPELGKQPNFRIQQLHSQNSDGIPEIKDWALELLLVYPVAKWDSPINRTYMSKKTSSFSTGWSFNFPMFSYKNQEIEVSAISPIPIPSPVSERPINCWVFLFLGLKLVHLGLPSKALP
jgi:hypothetical protein